MYASYINTLQVLQLRILKVSARFCQKLFVTAACWWSCCHGFCCRICSLFFAQRGLLHTRARDSSLAFTATLGPQKLWLEHIESHVASRLRSCSETEKSLGESCCWCEYCENCENVLISRMWVSAVCVCLFLGKLTLVCVKRKTTN